MEEDFGGGQGLTKDCGAKGKRRRSCIIKFISHNILHLSVYFILLW